MDRDGRRSLRGRRVRRTRQQIRMQTSSVGNTYPVSESTFPEIRMQNYIGTTRPVTPINDTGNMNQLRSDWATTTRTNIPDIHCVVAEPTAFRTPFQLGLDGTIRPDTSSDSGSGSDPLNENSYLLVDSADRSDGISIEDPLPIEVDESAVDCEVSETHRTELLVRWQSITAILLTCGTVRMTVKQYETVRELLAWASAYGNLPSIRTVQRTIIPAVRDYAYARSSICSLKTKGKQAETGSSISAAVSKQGQVRIVLPSQWAVLDCRTGPVFDSMFGENSNLSSPNLKPLFSDIETTPIIQRRSRFLDTATQIYVDPPYSGSVPIQERLPIQARAGDIVSIMLQYPEDFRAALGQDGPMAGSGLDSGHLLGSIRSVWQIEGCRPVLDPMRPQQNASFSMCSLLQNGDTVAELDQVTATIRQGGGVLYLLVFRFCRLQPGDATRQLIILEKDLIEDGSMPAARCVTANVVCVRMYDEPTPDEVTSYSPSTGRLSNGRKYVVYRVMLYTDDFLPTVSRTGSYGGCYMLPLGIKPEERAGFNAVRCIGLTSPSVSTNEVLFHIIPDIINCTKNGVEGKTALGESVTIFLDVVGYIGDYPAVTNALDVLGHNSRAPCHLCSFVRQDRTGGKGLNYYGYSTSVHSRTSAFCREAGRIRMVRRGVFPSSLFQSLGLKHTVDAGNCPLHALSDALSKVRSQVPLTDRGLPVVPALFDPYRSSMVAPDHLLFGLAQDIINACITICSPSTRATAEVLMRDALLEHNLGAQKHLFSRASLTLHSMTMSEVFVVLLVAPSSFYSAIALHGDAEILENSETPSNQQYEYSDGLATTSAPGKKSRKKRARGAIVDTQPDRAGVRAIDLIHLLSMFQELVAETHYLPRIDVDGVGPLQEFNKGQGMERLDRLFHLASRYVSDLHHVCTRSPEGVGKILNKPNVHRLLELYVHTLPAFGHVRHFQELLFETAHQPLKRGIKRSNNRDPHLAAVTAVLANDWETRLALEVGSAGDPDKWSDAACRRIQQLLTGAEGMDSVYCSRLKTAFSPPVLAQLEKVRRRLLSVPSAYVEWKIEHTLTGRPPSFAGSWRACSTSNQGIVDQAISCFIRRSMGAGFDQSTARIGSWATSWNVQHRGAEFSIQSTDHEKRKESIQPGSLVQSLVRPGALCSDPACPVRSLTCPGNDGEVGDSSFEVSYWVVLELFEANLQCDSFRDDAVAIPHAVVLPCQQDGSSERNRRFRANSEGPAFILTLGTSTRVVLCLHACSSSSCTENGAPGILRHSGNLTRGCSFYGLGRRAGYPPRVG